jgi:TP901 family phage tail tape measure protein
MAMNQMGAGFVLRGKDLASGTVKKFAATLKGLKGLLGNVGAAMTAVGAASFKMGKLITGSLLASANAAGTFEQGLAAVGAVTNATTQEMELLRESAIQAGIETQFSPDEAVEGLTSLATAGQMATDATKTLIPVLDLAAGSLGQLGVAESAEAVVGTLNAYGLAAEESTMVTDKLLRITQLSNFQARDFAIGLSKAAAAGGMFGQNIDDVLITMGMLRNRNIDASSSATGLREALRRTASDANAQNAIMEAGVDIYDKQTGKMRSIIDIMNDFSKGTKKMAEEERNRLINQAFGARGMLAFASIEKAMFTEMVNGEKVIHRGEAAIEKLREKMADASGTAKDFKESLLDTFEGQKTLLKGTLQTLSVAFGEPLAKLLKPVVGFITNSLNTLLKAFSSLPMPVKKFLLGITGMGAVLMTAVGGLIVMVGMLKIFNVTLGGVIASMGAFVGIMIPLTLLVAGFSVAFVAASKSMRKETRDNKSAWESMTDTIKTAYNGALQILKQGELSKAFRKQLEDTNQHGVLKFLDGFANFVERAKRFWDGLVMGFEIGVAKLGPQLNALKAEFGGIFDLFKDDPTGDSMERWIDNGMSAGETLASLGGTALEVLTTLVRVGKEIGAAFADVTAEDVSNGIRTAVESFKTLITVLETTSMILGGIWTAARGLFNLLQTLGAGLGEGLGWIVSGFDSDAGFTETKKQWGEMMSAMEGNALHPDEEQPRKQRRGKSTLSKDRASELQQLAADLRFEAETLEGQRDSARGKKKREKLETELNSTMAKLNTVLDRLQRQGIKAEVEYKEVADAAERGAGNDEGRNLDPTPVAEF